MSSTKKTVGYNIPGVADADAATASAGHPAKTTTANNGILESARADDFIEYFLYPNLSTTNLLLTEDQIQLELNNHLTAINKIVKKLTNDYIWHKDEFCLRTPIGKYPNNSTTDGFKHQLSMLREHLPLHSVIDDALLPPHLYGITFYGDNIDDEWFIVAILFEISKRIPDIIVRVIDSDGEFLLIEAADHLPDWANPDTCEQRVYIFSGHIHLIPNNELTTANANDDDSDHDDDDDDERNDEDPSKTSVLPINLALEKLRENSNGYKLSSEIENSIRERFGKFLVAIDDAGNCTFNELHHNATVYLPIAAAALLKYHPNLIASAVRAFYNRDAIDMKACRAMKHFPPENRIFTRVKFTKCLYAMLTHTKYQPDRRTGWNLPNIADPSVANQQLYRSHSLGVKIACGFEILTSQSGQLQMKEWEKYLSSLKVNGYFQNFIESSRDYERLLALAHAYFKDNFQLSYDQDRREIGTEILHLLKHIDLDQFMNEHAAAQQTEFNGLTDDNDDWLNIDSNELDNMLKARYGIRKIISTNQNNDEETTAGAANDFTNIMTNFLNKKSDFEGIEMNNQEQPPIVPKRKKHLLQQQQQPQKPIIINVTSNEKQNNNKNSEQTTTTTTNNIDFNPDSFQSHLKDMLDLIIPEDKWESNSDVSDDFGGDESDLEKHINEMDNEILLLNTDGNDNGTSTNDHNQNRTTTTNRIKTNLKEYMDQMDRELARTTIGKSFENQKQSSLKKKHKKKSTTPKTTPKSKSFDATEDHEDDSDEDEDDFDDIETFKPVNIDVNTLKHMANSYQSQFGGTGPVSNLLATMGMKLSINDNNNNNNNGNETNDSKPRQPIKEIYDTQV